MLKLLRLLPLLLIIGSGCSLFGEKDNTKGWSAQKLYVEATTAMKDADWEKAIKYYGFLEARYPFGRYAMQSRLNIAYAHHKDGDAALATAAVNRFLKLHPKSPAAEYAHYLKGLINFQRDLGFVARFLPTDASQRDAGAAKQSLKDFAELIRLYPKGQYSADARQRMIYLRNMLARHEALVAGYYLRRGAYVAANRRASYVVENYQRTPAIRSALEILAKSYDGMGEQELAEDTRRVLAANKDNIPANFRLEGERSWAESIWDYLGLDEN